MATLASEHKPTVLGIPGHVPTVGVMSTWRPCFWTVGLVQRSRCVLAPSRKDSCGRKSARMTNTSRNGIGARRFLAISALCGGLLWAGRRRAAFSTCCVRWYSKAAFPKPRSSHLWQGSCVCEKRVATSCMPVVQPAATSTCLSWATSAGESDGPYTWLSPTGGHVQWKCGGMLPSRAPPPRPPQRKQEAIEFGMQITSRF